jgi:hypothetical protein
LTENRQNIPIYGIQPIQKLKTKLFIQICVCIFFRPTDLHFIPSLHQFIYEIEDGYTPDGSTNTFSGWHYLWMKINK